MSVDPAVVDLLRSLAPVLGRWGPWYLFGAQALNAHGVPRLTADVDVTLRLELADLDRFAKILAGRPKDMEDAHALWRALGSSLDASRIESILGLIEQALDRRDLLPELASIRRRWPVGGSQE